MSPDQRTDYVERIRELAGTASDVHDIDLFAEKDADVTPPTMAFSEFLINKEQGDWAERLIKQLANRELGDFETAEYGRSEDKVAGEPGFAEFYRAFHREMAGIRKSPDLLVFPADAIDEVTLSRVEDVEGVPRSDLVETVRSATAGLEVRSSSYLAQKYSKYHADRKSEQRSKVERRLETVEELTEELLSKPDLEDPERLREYVSKVRAYATAPTKDEAPTYRTTAPIQRMAEANLFSENARRFLEAANGVREAKKQTFGRDHLSVTVKVEDLIVVRNWVETHGVPHYYVQVFFDSVFVLGFERILELLANPDENDQSYRFERNQKNQMKHTIHIDIGEGVRVAESLPRPETYAAVREHPDGRLQNYVMFETSKGALESADLYGERIENAFRS